MKTLRFRVWMMVAGCCVSALVSASAQSFRVSFPKERSSAPLDGRLLLMLSSDSSAEPRMQIDDTPRSQMIFGVTVDGMAPGVPATVDATAWGYPIRSLRDVPAGDYTVQALLNRYETFHRADGTTVKLRMDQGEGQHWNLAPGNLYSKPKKIHVGEGGEAISVEMTEEIQPIAEPKDTKYIRHIKIQSELLTKFWGRPMYLSAVVLVPEGFDEHPDAHYPLMLFHDHFVDGFDDFRTTPPDANLKPVYSERFHLAGYNRIQQEEAYKSIKQWIGAEVSALCWW